MIDNFTFTLHDIHHMYHLNDIESEYLTLINNKLKNTLIHRKNKIDNNKQKWDIAKKLTNDYELILHTMKKENKQPISRAYYKIFEIISEFHEYFVDTMISKTAHIAEGPGGFIEAIVDMFPNKSFMKHGITLKSSNNNKIPSWKFSKQYMFKNNIRLHFGKDGTGDMYDLNNCKHFIQEVGYATCSVITADGGFDFSKDYNEQEYNFNSLLWSEIYMIIKLQSTSGSCIFKIFDMFNQSTIDAMYIISLLYDKMYIIKPFSSRPANSEKYVVATQFNNNFLIKDRILNLIEYNWRTKHNINLPTDISSKKRYNNFIYNMTIYNTYYTNRQITYIDKTLYDVNLFEQMNEVDKLKYIDSIKSKNEKQCIEWCKQYGIRL